MGVKVESFLQFFPLLCTQKRIKAKRPPDGFPYKPFTLLIIWWSLHLFPLFPMLHDFANVVFLCYHFVSEGNSLPIWNTFESVYFACKESSTSLSFSSDWLCKDNSYMYCNLIVFTYINELPLYFHICVLAQETAILCLKVHLLVYFCT